MAKDFARAFYNSKAWKDCKNTYSKKMLYLCERCGAPGLEVHHKIRITPENINNPEITLNFDNLELLCHKCHTQEHKREIRVSKLRYVFDEEGHVIPIDE